MSPEELSDLCSYLEDCVDGVEDGGMVDDILLSKNDLDWLLDQIYFALKD